MCKEDADTGPAHVLQGEGAGLSLPGWGPVSADGVPSSALLTTCTLMHCTACCHPRDYVMFTRIKGPEAVIGSQKRQRCG